MATASEVDSWFTQQLGLDDDATLGAQARAREAGLPDIAVSAAQGAFLRLLARVAGARRVLEVGTLGGYSTIWLARGLPADGRVVTLELDPRHAEVARVNVDAAGVGDRVEIVVGPATETLPRQTGPFDMVFLDADKENNGVYLRAALDLSAPGTLIVIDNVVRDGVVADPDNHTGTVAGVRDAVAVLASDPRIECSTVAQTLDVRGWDGMLLARRV